MRTAAALEMDAPEARNESRPTENAIMV